MEGMGFVPNLSVKRSISIGTMINFDNDGDGDGTCKQAFKASFTRNVNVTDFRTI